MNQIFETLKGTNIFAFLILICLIIIPKTRPNVFKILSFSSIGLVYLSIINKFRDLETVQLLLKFHPKDLIQTITTRVRLTSSKSLPDLKNLNVKSLIKAIHIRCVTRWLSPVHRYITWVKEVLIEFIKTLKQNNTCSFNEYYA